MSAYFLITRGVNYRVSSCVLTVLHFDVINKKYVKNILLKNFSVQKNHTMKCILLHILSVFFVVVSFYHLQLLLFKKFLNYNMINQLLNLGAGGRLLDMKEKKWRI